MPDNDFDAELEAIMGGSEVDLSQTPGKDTTAPAATPAPAPSVIEAGGRKFNTSDELAKAYDAIVRDYTKKSQYAKRAEPWVQFGEMLDKHPELRSLLTKHTDEYFKAKQAPAQQGQPVQPGVYDKRLEELQNRLDDMAVDREINDLRTKYNLDDKTLDEICEESESLGGIPLEKAYRIVKSKEFFASNQAKVQATAEAARKKAEAGNVGPSNSPQVVAAPKSVSKLTNDEWRIEGEKLLTQLGVE
jgi:hypothetical protein